MGERHRKEESWHINDSIRQDKDTMDVKENVEHVKRGQEKGRRTTTIITLRKKVRDKGNYTLTKVKQPKVQILNHFNKTEKKMRGRFL